MTDEEPSSEATISQNTVKPKEKTEEKATSDLGNNEKIVKPPGSSDNGFKLPKKLVIPENPIKSRSNASEEKGSPINLNGSSMANLNKSLKVKQRIINNKGSHLKNATMISEIVNVSPLSSAFPAGISNDSDREGSVINSSSSAIANSNFPGSGITSPSTGAPLNSSIIPPPGPPTISTTADTSGLSTTSLPSNNSTTTMETSSKNSTKSKKKANNATRTDFFAAKLASAVDDVESSDSDETFVYEDNVTKNSATNNSNMAVAPSPRTEARSNNGSVINVQGTIAHLSDELPTSTIQKVENPSIRSVKLFPKSVSTGAVVNNKASENSTPKDSVTTISGKERPQSQRSNSVYSVAHPSIHQQDVDNSNLNTIRTHSMTESPSGSAIIGTHSDTHHDNTDSVSHIPPAINSGMALFDKPIYNSSISAQTSLHDGYHNEDRYSVVDVDEDGAESLDLDTYVSHNNNGDITITENGTSRNVNGGNQHTGSNHGDNHLSNENTNNNDDLCHINENEDKSTSNYKNKKTRSSTTNSSKLRSTTSKLFDKKGSQPRRYSIIPNDIDIEDFDDELIYYDNHIRFPYGNNSINTNQFNESSPLLNQQAGRIPHYRSLNLNFNDDKRPKNFKRYLSTGQGYLNTGNNAISSNLGSNLNDGNNAHGNPDIFPFPYPDHHSCMYDFEEYDEDSQSENDRLMKLGHRGSKNSEYPHLNSTNGHFILPRKKSSISRTKANCVKSFLYTFVGILSILSIGFIMGFLLASTKELNHAEISSVANTLVSQDELVFNIIVEAFNPGWFSINIDDVELDIFAKSGYLSDEDTDDNGTNQNPSTSVETVLLGSIYNLEFPMTFKGSFFSKMPSKQLAEIKLVAPGKNISSLEVFGLNSTDPEVPDNSKKWEVIAKNPFDLIIRGVLKYKLPMSGTIRSIMVKKTAYVDPNDPM